MPGKEFGIQATGLSTSDFIHSERRVKSVSGKSALNIFCTRNNYLMTYHSRLYYFTVAFDVCYCNLISIK